MQFLLDILKGVLLAILVVGIILGAIWIFKPEIIKNHPFIKKNTTFTDTNSSSGFSLNSSNIGQSQPSTDSGSDSNQSSENPVQNSDSSENSTQSETSQNSEESTQSESSDQNVEKNTEQISDEKYYFKGNIANLFALQIVLEKKEQQLEGFFINQNVGLPTKISGSIDQDGVWTFGEFDESKKQRAEFKASPSFINQDLVLTGNWKELSSQTSFDFLARQAEVFQADENLQNYNYLIVEPQIVQEQKDSYQLNILYPQIRNFASTQVQSDINKTLSEIFSREETLRQFTEAKENQEKNCQNKEEENCSTNSFKKINYQVLFNSKDILSIEMQEELYLAGDKNATKKPMSYNFDLKTGKLLELKELFKDDKYQAVLQQKIQNELKKEVSLNELNQFSFSSQNLHIAVMTSEYRFERVLIPWQELKQESELSDLGQKIIQN